MPPRPSASSSAAILTELENAPRPKLAAGPQPRPRALPFYRALLAAPERMTPSAAAIFAVYACIAQDAAILKWEAEILREPVEGASPRKDPPQPKKAEDMTAAEVLEWLRLFAHQNPRAWGAATHGSHLSFAQSVGLFKVDKTDPTGNKRMGKLQSELNALTSYRGD